MAEKVGIKETKEALVAVLSLSAVMAEKLKDGAQLSDAVEVWAKFQSDEAFKSQLIIAWENAKAIPGECQDIDMSEALEILMVAIPGVKKILEGLAK